ncbi:hypothetical protein D6D21_06844 [Aureobasidium pullulans]|uniref:Zn(2)-C6 fungal-type domain-containing protein n=1 Tax=Aureobasidium pullulans TaxID=5580 RepID=A0AB74ISZ3_AURPU|nr:hypothetical protein D6D21_06844 [Aureobasidium pullulans]
MTSPGYATFSQEDDCAKQRASKACNRCRAEKARCSGGYPCSRCKSSDTVCIFGFAKKPKRKVFPEQTLEMQQFKLAAGLQTMYFMLLAAKAWPGTQLPEHKGNPLVHDVLDRLGLLEHKDGQDIDIDFHDHETNTQHSSAEEVLPMKHPKHDHDAVQASPIPPAVHAE